MSQPAVPAPPDPVDRRERVVGAVANVLTWVTGLLVLLFSDRERRYARWNAIQAIGVGVLAVLAVTVVSLAHLTILFVQGGGHVPPATQTSAGFLPVPFVFTWGLVPQLGNLTVLVVGVYLAWRAYRGRPVRVPVLAELADEHA